jgi:hypothetical protein
VLLEPRLLGLQRVAAPAERPERWAADRRQVCQPVSLGIGFDMAGPADGEWTEHRQVHGFGIEATDSTIGFNAQDHGWFLRRMIDKYQDLALFAPCELL